MSSLEVHGIDHITIVSDDLEKSRQFYVDLLGMVQLDRPDFGFPGMWFLAGTTMIHLNIAGENSGRPGFPDMGAISPSQGLHYAFLVDDCDAAAERMAEAGYQLFDGPRSRPDGARQFYIRDPDDHLVEICSAPPADRVK